MKRVVLTFFCFIFCLSSILSANEDFINLFHLAVEKRDSILVNDVIEADIE